jgi:RimJ/RimL family protein N-acetyltransferase
MNGRVSLRDVRESDLETFFAHQRDPEATRMAAFPSRERDAFFAHWKKVMSDASNIVQAVMFEGELAGNVVSWEQDGERKVGYWIGRDHWGKGVASAAMSQFLRQLTVRPLVAHVAKHNAASIRVLQKCGFSISGEDRFQLPGGESVEDYILTLTSEGPSDESR